MSKRSVARKKAWTNYQLEAPFGLSIYIHYMLLNYGSKEKDSFEDYALIIIIKA